MIDDSSPLLTVLTPRERDVTRLIVIGLSNKEIARQLGISDGTVKLHLHNIYQKLALRNRTMLAMAGKESWR